MSVQETDSGRGTFVHSQNLALEARPSIVSFTAEKWGFAIEMGSEGENESINGEGASGIE